MSRPIVRTAVLTALAAGAVLLPSAAALADGTPTPVPAEPATASAAPAERTATPEPRQAARTGRPTPAPEPMPASRMPRGGVDAGERPAQDAAGTALYGTAAGAVLLAGAGVLVVRRRTAAQRNG
ncbi:hypothetical protein OG206_03215 [Streptomyces sp. NBC_01341]|uniref:hypothetical protein n=1 Tax=Streptomyces sp. NBC_01341 TaxID=2903831 RepID=UPI002E0F8E33|nr:hypothetical protein OG206_03215 [Streptomyces sp. NBC_01341]